jgi:glycosyltransferase involved in cell wall biosynthesis
MPKAVKPRRVLILFNTVALYGMERSVIETFDLLRPEVEPHLLMSYTTKRENLPVLTEVKKRNLPHSFFSDWTSWPRIQKPKSWREVWPLFVTMLRGNRDVLKAARHHDVIYVPSIQYFYFAILAAFLYKLTRRKIIYSCHDLIAHHSLPLKLAIPLLSVFRHNTRLSYDYFVRVAPDVAKKKNYIAPPYIDVPHGENGSSQPLEHLHDKRNILFLGQVAKHKGIGLLVDAFKLVACNYPDAVLHVVGGADPELILELQESLVATNLRDKVIFWGYRNDGHKFLAKAYVYVQPSPPSICNESFGRSAVEAMAAGVPTICFRSGALQEIILHEETGLLCDAESAIALAECLRRFLDAPAFTTHCGRAARARYKSHYAGATVKALWLRAINNYDDDAARV